MSHNPNLPRCEYCRQLFMVGIRGGCICCGAPAPNGQQGVLPVPMDAPLAILKVKDSLSDRQIDEIHKQWEGLFAGSNHPRLVILEEGMDLQFIGHGLMSANELRRLYGFDEMK